jgi:hypothetical protein
MPKIIIKQTAPDDATVENSNQSYTDTVASGGTLVLPDITVTDSDGSTFTQPAVENVTCTLVDTIDTDFSADKLEVTPSETIQFTDLSTGLPTQWAWRFDSEGNSDLENPTFAFSTVGLKTVRLLSAKDGAGDFIIKSNYITVRDLNPSEIFGADLYDWWDFTDNSTLSLTGSAINSVSSKKSGSTRSFVASGGARPTLVPNLVNGLQGARFDGLASFMQVNSSTALYNFLHNQNNGGCVIIVNKITDANPDALLKILENGDGNTLNVGNTIAYDDRSSASRNNVIFNSSQRAVSATTTYVNVSANNFYTTQQFNILRSIVDPNNGTATNRSKLSVNFGANIQNNASTNAPSTANATNNLTLGRGSATSSFYFKGDIAEIIISQNQPTPTQLTQIQAYLTAKYGTFPI